jgi:hypothetical protein
VPPRSQRAKEAASVIDVVISKAHAMRGAGVEVFALDGLSFNLRAPEPLAGDSGPTKSETTDPFDDPASYPHGGRVPGYAHGDDDAED